MLLILVLGYYHLKQLICLLKRAMALIKIITYNVNGLRAAINKGWLKWVEDSGADIVCLQEIKVEPGQLDLSVFEKLGFHHFWMPAQKKGYSGVAILSKFKPTGVVYGCGMEVYDREGRVIRIDFDELSVMSVYMPSGTTGDERQNFKFRWLTDFNKYIMVLKKKKKLIICGDYNICHQPIDIHNPIANARSSGFLPEERAWVSGFLNNGFIDTFRHFNSHPNQYTWWTYRANAREKNLGWRIDYIMASEKLKENIRHAAIHPQAIHSDHCPVSIDISFDAKHILNQK